MKATYLQLAAALALTFGMAACVPAAKAPPAPVAAPAPPAAPARYTLVPQPIEQVPPSTAWADAPLTPGSWRYVDYGPGRGKRVLFFPGADEAFDITCALEPRGPQILLIRIGQPRSDPAPMTIRTETEQRTLIARASGQARMIASLQVSDPLLDAMAFSKGRFAVEVDGLPALYLPSHAEVSRVIEDCR